MKKKNNAKRRAELELASSGGKAIAKKIGKRGMKAMGLAGAAKRWGWKTVGTCAACDNPIYVTKKGRTMAHTHKK